MQYLNRQFARANAALAPAQPSQAPANPKPTHGQPRPTAARWPRASTIQGPAPAPAQPSR
jgi:hypothetical protein